MNVTTLLAAVRRWFRRLVDRALGNDFPEVDRYGVKTGRTGEDGSDT